MANDGVFRRPFSVPPRLQAGLNTLTAPNFPLIAANASYTFNGQSIFLSPSLLCSAASFTLAAQPATLTPGTGVLALAASYTLTGINALFPSTGVASPASYVLNGVAANLFGSQIFQASPASYTLNGVTVGFGRPTASDPAAFILAFPATALSIRELISAASFTVSGISSALSPSDAASTAQFQIVAWEIADVQGPTGDHNFLVIVQAHDGTSLNTYYISTDGFTSLAGDSPSNQHYMPRVIDPGNFQQQITLPGEGDNSSSSSGDVVVATADAGDGVVLDNWFTYGFGDRPIEIKALPYGATSVAQAQSLFLGRTGRLKSTEPLDSANITIANKLLTLQKPLLSARFAGTTLGAGNTAEGNADLAGQIKQQVWGEAANVPVQAANPYNLIYLVSNVTANSQLVSITLYDGGLALTYDSDQASIAALNAASISAGHYCTCLALGLVRLGGTPAKAVTADVVEGTSSTNRTAAQIVKRMLLDYGVDISEISTGSFSDLDVKNNAVCYAFVNSDSTVLTEAQLVLDSIGARLLPNRSDLYEVTRVEEPTFSATLSFDVDRSVIAETSLERLEGSPPTWQVNLEWGKVHTVQNRAELAGAVTDTRAAYLSTQLRTALAQDSGVKTQYRDALVLTYETRLAKQADAQTEASRILDLLKSPRDEYSVTMPLSAAWAANVGGSVTLKHPRLGLASGKNFLVLSRIDEYVSETVTLARVWG